MCECVNVYLKKKKKKSSEGALIISVLCLLCKVKRAHAFGSDNKEKNICHILSYSLL